VEVDGREHHGAALRLQRETPSPTSLHGLLLSMGLQRL